MLISCSKQELEDDERKPHRLDTTRIHPESYTLAVKIALDAMDVGEAVQEKGDNDEDAEAIRATAIRELMADPADRLDALEEGLPQVR